MKEISSYKQNLRPSILAEATRQFSERGINAVKMDDISKSLGISKRTLYELYSNKEDLLLEVIRHIRKENRAAITQFAENCDNVMDVLLEVLRRQSERMSQTNVDFFNDMVKYPRASELMRTHFEEQKGESTGFFDRGVKEGYFVDHVNYIVLLEIVSGTMHMMRTDPAYRTMSHREIFLNYISVVIRGICTVKGIEKIDKFIEEHF